MVSWNFKFHFNPIMKLIFNSNSSLVLCADSSSSQIKVAFCSKLTEIENLEIGNFIKWNWILKIHWECNFLSIRLAYKCVKFQFHCKIQFCPFHISPKKNLKQLDDVVECDSPYVPRINEIKIKIISYDDVERVVKPVMSSLWWFLKNSCDPPSHFIYRCLAYSLDNNNTEQLFLKRVDPFHHNRNEDSSQCTKIKYDNLFIQFESGVVQFQF